MFTTKIQATLPQFQRHSLRYTGYSGTHYSKKLSRLALLLANALSMSSGVGQCTPVALQQQKRLQSVLRHGRTDRRQRS
jgi:hypothetical protein